MKLKETVIRNGKEDIYFWNVKQLTSKEFSCPDLGFRFNIETGETTKTRGGKKITLGVPFKSGRRQITYEIVKED